MRFERILGRGHRFRCRNICRMNTNAPLQVAEQNRDGFRVGSVEDVLVPTATFCTALSAMVGGNHPFSLSETNCVLLKTSVTGDRVLAGLAPKQLSESSLGLFPKALTRAQQLMGF